MNKVNAFLGKYWHTIIALGVVALILYLVYRAGKKQGGQITVTDDSGNLVTPTPQQEQEATEVATRIHDDLNSGAFGYNPFGTLGRDIEGYRAFSQMSDRMFSYTYNKYKSLFDTSIISDIRAESSISDAGIVRTILERADRLNLT